jgi:hypothetical protein
LLYPPELLARKMEAFPIFSRAESQVEVLAFSVAQGGGNFYGFFPDCRSSGLCMALCPRFIFLFRVGLFSISFPKYT